MIKLDVDDNCQECGNFEAESVTFEKGYIGKGMLSYHTIITCKNRDKCKKMMEYLKSKMK